jgi:hypothetical protein
MGQARRRVDCRLLAGAIVAVLLTVGPAAPLGASTTGNAASTVWLCKPGATPDPCTFTRAATAVSATGGTSAATMPSSPEATKVDCFYVYPTVSSETTTNADLRIQKAEEDAAVAQASPFSGVCQVWAPMYEQVTVAGLAAHPDLDIGPGPTATAYDSIRSGFEDFVKHDDGRPIVLIGDSQGSAMLILLLSRLVDDDAALRHRLLLALILGGNVEVKSGSTTGGSFTHIPVCRRQGQTGCVIAYSSFPSQPPSDSLFGRPGQGVSLQSDQTRRRGLSVACTNPAALAGGTAPLTPFLIGTGAPVPSPWVTYPGLYRARCESKDGATWLEVTKATGPGDTRPVVTEAAGPLWGYHADDLNLALGNLLTDVAAAEHTWARAGHH